MIKDRSSPQNPVHLFLVQVQVMNVHEMRKLENKLENRFAIVYRGYVPGADSKNRPTTKSAHYIVCVINPRLQAFKALLKLNDREMASRISYRCIHNPT